MAQWFSNVTVPSSSVVNTNERCPPVFQSHIFCDGVRLREGDRWGSSPGYCVFLGEGLSELMFDDYFPIYPSPQKRYTKEPQNVT